MAVRNITYGIPSWNLLSCISCDQVLRNVSEAIEHTVVCRKKNKLVKKYEGVDQIEKKKGSVTWTRVKTGHLLNLFHKKVSDLGKAKAHYRTYELGKVHAEIASELEDIIGPGVTHYQVTRKWTMLRKQVLQYDKVRKKQLTEGFQPSDPPTFYPSVKEIMRCVEEEKIKYLKEMENSEESYLLKIKDQDIETSQQGCPDKDKSLEHPEEDEETCKISQSEEGEPCSMIIKRNTVLRIINQLEEGIQYPEIMKEFDITDSVLTAIDQNRDTICQGAQRCSLCLILMSTEEDVVAHEIECCKIPQHLKDIKSFSIDEDEPFIGFLPETVNELVDVILKWYPKFTRRVNWSKVASQLTHMQSGVTPSRCSQKWHNLTGRCRRYQRLDSWAKRNDCSHSNLPPDFYSRIIPYAESQRVIEPSQDSIQRFLAVGHPPIGKLTSSTSTSHLKNTINYENGCEGKESPVCNGSDDDEDFYADEDEIESNEVSTNLEDSDEVNSEEEKGPQSQTVAMEQHYSESSLPKPSLSNAESSFNSVSNKKKNGGLKNITECEGNFVGTRSNIEKADRIQTMETKLDKILGILSNVMKENQRLTQAAEKKSKDNGSDGDIAQKLDMLGQIFTTTHKQNMKQLQSMAKMWERHHDEHLTMIKTLITKISSKTKIHERKGIKRKRKLRN